MSNLHKRTVFYDEAAGMALAPQENWLVFIDTNIFLDFYRLGGESAARQLAALQRHHGSIITCDQIRMEFFKNRQKVIVESLGKLQKPNRMSVPPILTDYQPAKMMAKHIDASVKQYNAVRVKIDNILNDPIHHDPVYSGLNRLWDHAGELNLKRTDKRRFGVRHLARKRFVLGYPPRKAGDTSIGDAFNWEWIVACAQASPPSSHVLIVSRDSDYGVTFGENSILNDWLLREFKERVSRKRKIELTTRLTTALKRLDEHVSAEDEREEANLLIKPKYVIDDNVWALWAAEEKATKGELFNELLSNFVKELKERAPALQKKGGADDDA